MTVSEYGNRNTGILSKKSHLKVWKSLYSFLVHINDTDNRNDTWNNSNMLQKSHFEQIEMDQSDFLD